MGHLLGTRRKSLVVLPIANQPSESRGRNAKLSRTKRKVRVQQCTGWCCLWCPTVARYSERERTSWWSGIYRVLFLRLIYALPAQFQLSELPSPNSNRPPHCGNTTDGRCASVDDDSLWSDNRVLAVRSRSFTCRSYLTSRVVQSPPHIDCLSRVYIAHQPGTQIEEMLHLSRASHTCVKLQWWAFVVVGFTRSFLSGS